MSNQNQDPANQDSVKKYLDEFGNEIEKGLQDQEVKASDTKLSANTERLDSPVNPINTGRLI